MTDWLFDGVLVSLLLALAIASIFTKHLFNSIMLYIAFGLLLAITWARLGAVDLALAEAAIGAGITGVLLLSAYAQSNSDNDQLQKRQMPWLAFAFLILILIWLIQAVWSLAGHSTTLIDLSQQALPESGVSHPTTAVLLNFRAWDTLLELGVLLLAFLGARQLAIQPYKLPTSWPLLTVWSQILAPIIVVVGGYILWRGTSAPGGAFQAGALLAAGAILLRLTQIIPPLSWHSLWLRGLVLMGVSLFILVAAATAFWGDAWLQYPLAFNGLLIFSIEIAATLSIAATLTWLVVGERRTLHP
ncbi:MAG: DUF4040 domain-containing protein [Gammaproteobacteria bacterium]|nr:DUF4040 domain-containing protein [Gammaproteobacteria bacterium]